ncbi:hypothetical protein PAAG_08377 [Paracoccidioides lutzii Pb01]|uniref:Retrovirus-related Pol polyprotein from transposon TNT 1-94-like beta-barrel domain-containing protein n=1 Tax=Paracoccidioides lutzii (strain ATCC MYA-826 / Pb01) TaxID=502779 RepID=C1HC86_PARBA|nr:hypothetical protein PAAG_08377 [Paracoccidioides lutzii Pb01]EEH38650.1 hypothetical protein PAAG_08377 [Paracoccidioides lutzii Pb01]
MEDTWVLDSRSEAHITPLKDIVKVTPQRMNVMLEMADGSTAPIAAAGRISISTEDIDTQLDDVHYILKLEVNLMSLDKLVCKGYTFKQLTYGNNHSILVMSPDRMTNFTVNLNDENIYVVEKPPALRDMIGCVMPNG